MSTKTNFKRIALVAVAALGLGVLSSVPSQAAVTSLTVTAVNGTASLVKSDSTTAGTLTITGLMEVADSITVTLVTKSTPGGSVPAALMHNLDSTTSTITNYVVDTRGAGIKPNIARASNTAALAVLSTASASTEFVLSKSSAAANISAVIGVQLDSSTARIAGTYTYTALVKAYHASSTLNSGASVQPDQTISKDISITVAAAGDVSNTATATYGFAFLSSSTTTAGSGSSTTTDASISALATTGTTRGYLYVGVRNADNGATTADESLTATVTGVGLVCLDDGSSCGKNLGPVSVTAGDYEFELRGDGSGGTSSIKVTGSVTGASYTKTVTYYAAAAKTMTASVLTPQLAIGSNDSAVAVTAVDAAGAKWGGSAYIYASAAADATAVGGSATTPVACVYSVPNDKHYCPISATAVGTGKFKVIDAATIAAATATSNEVTVTSKSATPATVRISFNKANYVPGEIGLIIITPLDAAGAALPASTISNALASGGISSDVGLNYAGASIAASLADTTATLVAYNGTTTVAGSETIIFTAPTTGGKITLTAKGGSGLPLAGQVAITASATVTDNGAAALAAVTALATTVASLKTLITTLTNLVLKIQKKVKA